MFKTQRKEHDLKPCVKLRLKLKRLKRLKRLMQKRR